MIQTKLTVSAPGDRFEQEADRVADQIVGTMPATRVNAQSGVSNLQRKCDSCASGSGKCESCAEEETVRLKPISSGANQTGRALSGHESSGAMAPLQGSGSPLSIQDRDFFEPRLGRDLSRVRIHSDATAAESARSLRAQAYTTRQHIVFAAGRYASHTPAGLRLLAHELAHVVQQSGGASAGTIQRASDDALTPVQKPPVTGPQPDKKQCSEEREQKLDDEKEKQCKDQGKQSCSMQSDDCTTATEKVAYWNRCIDAREKLQRTCFRKGDKKYEGHMLQISQSYAALRSCEGVEKEKCKSDTSPRIAPKD